MQVNIDAHFCTIARDAAGNRTSRTHSLFADEISRVTTEVKSAGELANKMSVIFADTKAAHPGRSFFVYAIKLPRSKGRAFAGFNGREWCCEFDADHDHAAGFQSLAERIAG